MFPNDAHNAGLFFMGRQSVDSIIMREKKGLIFRFRWNNTVLVNLGVSLFSVVSLRMAWGRGPQFAHMTWISK